MQTEASFKLAVLVSGRGSNLQAIIDSIERGELNAGISLVLSSKPDAPALDRAKNYGIPTHVLESKSFSGKGEFDRALVAELRSRKVDLICLAGFMRILSREVVAAFPGRIINIHPSLLPAFPGLNSQKQALDYGVKFAGCTIHFVDESVDCGPIILQAVVPVYDNDSPETLSARILEQEHRLYPRAIRLIQENQLTRDGRRVLQNPTSVGKTA
ncbi:MAG: phosphoribosylglycinamide formyltransferase [Nitrospinae bacterium CG11_big_fil_rev_8_21_14_0_20_56_8]|nr:MAG: phosphoribosylglycinamide formyltransferase [Nitrospinae bacterium CG11_big_fil_rev_8_21_14_0_20_56_8]